MKAKKAKSPSKSASKRKVSIKDLKAKDAGSVKGGLTTNLSPIVHKVETSVKLNIGGLTADKW
jgi:hypothetical protein